MGIAYILNLKIVLFQVATISLTEKQIINAETEKNQNVGDTLVLVWYHCE